MSHKKVISGNPLKLSLTGPGFSLILIIIAMLIAAMNYRNNMAYFFSFLMFGMLIVSLIYCLNNLRGLEVVSIQPQPAFAGSSIRFIITINNRTGKRRFSLFFTSPEQYRKGLFYGPFFVEPYSSTMAEIELPAHKRGQFFLSRIFLVSVYPMGFFRFIKTFSPNRDYIVYPKPDGLRQWPREQPTADEGVEGFYTRGGDDFSGYKRYRLGESQRHVDWKAVARGRPMLIKEFSGGGMVQQWFRWSDLSGMGIESKLSQLTRWILDADRSEVEYGMELPGSSFGPDKGRGFTRRCLQALALYNNYEIK